MATKRPRVLRFDVPYTHSPPPMTSPSVGIERVMPPGASAEFTEVTIIDTPDNRLLRAGVVVAHRLADGRGEWYLAGPGWVPRLPEEEVLPVDASGDLPEDFARLVHPITRGATLGPVAAMSNERREFTLMDAERDPLAMVQDDKVTVRRDGVTTARYRETSVTPSNRLTPQQREFIVSSMASASATAVGEFPSLQQRLGPPATGLSDFPEPAVLRRGATMEEFASEIFAGDLRELIYALLDLTAADPASVARINCLTDAILADVRGMAHVLEPAWREGIEALLGGEPPQEWAPARQRACELAEALVVATRAPKLGEASQQPAGELLGRRAEQAATVCIERCRALSPEAPEEHWRSALAATEQLLATVRVSEAVLGKPARKLARRITGSAEGLRVCVGAAPDPGLSLEGLDVTEAFELGRTLERRRAGIHRSRARFTAELPDRLAEIRRGLTKLGRAT
ncbi:MAG: hypothetical protein ACK5KO_12565 [Arachnia sp.]